MVVLSTCAQPTVPLEPVTITFAYPEPDTPYYERLTAAFTEQRPYVTVELRPQPVFEQSALAVESVDVLAGDVLLLSGFREGLLTLDPFVEEDESLELPDFYPGPARLFISEGETYAIPAGLDMYVMYYSQDLFDRYGVAYPYIGWTWVDFLERALAVTDAEAGIYGYSTTPEHADAILFAYTHGGRIVDDIEEPSRTTFDDPLTIEALEWYADLFHNYHVAPTALEANRAFGGGRYASYQGIRNGHVGMWILTLSERGGLMWPVEWTTTWGMVDLPSDAEPVTPVWAEGYAISASTHHPDACWQWLVFLTRQMHHRLVPARRSLAESDAYNELVGDEMASVVRTSLEYAVPYSPEIWTEFAPAMEAFSAAINDIIEGESTVQEALDSAQRRAEQ